MFQSETKSNTKPPSHSINKSKKKTKFTKENWANRTTFEKGRGSKVNNPACYRSYLEPKRSNNISVESSYVAPTLPYFIKNSFNNLNTLKMVRKQHLIKCYSSRDSTFTTISKVQMYLLLETWYAFYNVSVDLEFLCHFVAKLLILV